MTEIKDLRERVEAAEERFGLIDEQQQHYSERLIGLIETIEAQLAAARQEIENQIAENLRLSQENEELRSMLHTVLRSIEEKTFTETLQNLEARVCALVAKPQAGGGSPSTAHAATPADSALSDVPAASADEADSGIGPDIDAMVEPENDPGEAVEAPLILEAAPTDGTDAGGEELDAAVLEDAEMAGDTAALENPPLVEEPIAEASDEAAVEDAFSEHSPAADATTEADEREEVETAAVPEEPAASQPEPAPAEADLERPDSAMGDVTFEDDPQALAEAETGAEAEAAAETGLEAESEMTAAEAEDDGFKIAAMAPDEVEAAVADMDDPGTAEAAAVELETEPVIDPELSEPEAVSAPESSEPVEEAMDQHIEAQESAAREPGVDSAPSVKEIIRRVGDLARELEKAETQRKTSPDPTETASEEVAVEESDVGPPPFDKAANA